MSPKDVKILLHSVKLGYVYKGHQEYISTRPKGTGQGFFNLEFPATGPQSSPFHTVEASLSSM